MNSILERNYEYSVITSINLWIVSREPADSSSHHSHVQRYWVIQNTLERLPTPHFRDTALVINAHLACTRMLLITSPPRPTTILSCRLEDTTISTSAFNTNELNQVAFISSE